MNYLLMVPLVLWGVLWGVETAIGLWVRKMVRRAVPS